ncbi:hypothetical protein M406DRAFT_103905 [Cryphonectria parasitica EP155]|uniref:Uncharacterized protein n=1 Tax=Cryphonectria parasitica (strain ATCC 38755 / EP155) TaxID=660469 RepID=A0A9P5CN20_CRYP1|nr:uncharacterized protein M406DRAFT_103905 [Cryphonectria parasitica EP155]KAF3763671.1 hypothetical protein M406DRAFT_103905 [Cryphonectria parasitica EP155]
MEFLPVTGVSVCGPVSTNPEPIAWKGDAKSLTISLLDYLAEFRARLWCKEPDSAMIQIYRGIQELSFRVRVIWVVRGR